MKSPPKFLTTLLRSVSDYKSTSTGTGNFSHQANLPIQNLQIMRINSILKWAFICTYGLTTHFGLYLFDCLLYSEYWYSALESVL